MKIDARPLDIHQWLTKHSRIFRIVETGLREKGLISPENTPKGDVPYPLRFLSKEPTPETSHAWEITEMLLVELKNAVEASGACLVACYIPSSYALDRDLWKATKQRFGLSGDRWDTLQVESEFMRICRKHSIFCMGGAQEFQRGAESLGGKASRFYHVRDGHWNALGHKFVGKMMADRLVAWSKAEGLPLRPRRPYDTER